MYVFTRLAWLAVCVYVSQSSDVGVSIEDGESLGKMGTLFDNPLLRMLGKVFTNTEGLVEKTKVEIFEDLCDLHPCTAWSEWADCSAKAPSSYGMQSRNRKCGSDSPFCLQPQPDKKGMQLVNDRICEGRCNANYTLTPNGFCLRLHDKQTVSKDDADEICHKDGGYVININNEQKSDDLHVLLKDAGITSETIWINGRRNTLSDPWKFEYGAPSNWTNWYSNEPSNSGTQYCRVEQDNARYWYDRECVNREYWFVCEIV